MSELNILNCGQCGEIAMQAMDVATGKHGLVLSKSYYCHCFDGDCGAEGPRVPGSDQSIALWNAQQGAQT